MQTNSKTEQKTKNKFPFELKEKTFTELSKEPKFVEARNPILNKKKANPKFLAKTIMEDQYGFTIDSTRIKEISSDSYTSYTFLVHREAVDKSVFENLVVTIDSASAPKAYIIKYHLNSEPVYISEDDAYAIDAQTEITKINYNNAQARMSWMDGCVIVTVMCPWGGNHPAGQACVDAARGDLYFSADSSNCPDSPGDGGVGSPPGGGSPTSGGGGGSGGDNSNPTNNPGGIIYEDPICGGCITTAPVLPDINDEIDELDPDCDTSKEDLKKAFPNTDDSTLQEIADNINDYASDFDIDTKEELQHFLAQAGHESSNYAGNEFSAFEENLNYRVQKLGKDYWKKYFNDTDSPTADSTKANPNDYEQSSGSTFVDHEKFANYVYDDANRSSGYKLGNTGDDDGYNYRGRGIIQLTGKNNYTNFNNFYQDEYDSSVDLVSNPGLLASDKKIAVISALWFFKNNVMNDIDIDEDTKVKAVTKKVNGGTKGLTDRKSIFQKTKENIDCN